jgi:hypothetical protein
VVDHGKIYWSLYGTTWTQKVSGSTVSLFDISYVMITYELVGDEIILTSSDGTTWTSQTDTGISLGDVISIE